MIKIKYEQYYNDNDWKNIEKTFSNLKELENWMFSMVTGAYKYKIHFFDVDANHIVDGRLHLDQGCIHTSDDTYYYWINLIEDDEGILYSTGRYTNGICHVSEELKPWIRECRQRVIAPKFNFK